MNIKRLISVFLTTVLLAASGFSSAEAIIFPAEPASPTAEGLSMADAIAAAKNEMTQQENLSFADIENHKIKANFVRLENNDFAWVVLLESNEMFNRISASLIISSADASIIDYLASDPNSEVTMMLIDQWTKRKGAMRTWSIGDKALFNLLYGWQDVYVIPGESHISQEEAKAIALSALPRSLSSPEFSYSFDLLSYTDGRPEQYIWRVTILVQGAEKYQVQIAAIDGAVIEVLELGGLG